jgi:hypothetical protein
MLRLWHTRAIPLERKDAVAHENYKDYSIQDGRRIDEEWVAARRTRYRMMFDGKGWHVVSDPRRPAFGPFLTCAERRLIRRYLKVWNWIEMQHGWMIIWVRL